MALVSRVVYPSARLVDSPTPVAAELPAEPLRFFPGDGIRKAQTSTSSRRMTARSPTTQRKLAVTICGPGAGIQANQQAWASLDQNPRVYLQVFGQSRGHYDHYPLGWPGGVPSPNNLEFIAEELAKQGVVQNSDCLVFGSRGGQVVLPFLWSKFGNEMPPSIVINGGCAFEMPRQPAWPKNAVTLLVMGGNDYFRKPEISVDQYMAEARERVPKHNRFTAQLVVPEMGHVADQPVLSSLLTEEVFLALKQWPSNPQPFYHTFQNILLKLRQHRINASFFYTFAPGHWMRMPERIEQPEHLTRSRSPTKMLYSSIPRRQSPQSPQPQLYRELSERPRIPSYSSPLNAQLNAQMARAREISPVRSYMPTKRRNSLQHPQSARSFVPINVFGASMRLPAHQTVVVT